jgi:hypothetical protein
VHIRASHSPLEDFRVLEFSDYKLRVDVKKTNQIIMYSAPDRKVLQEPVWQIDGSLAEYKQMLNVAIWSMAVCQYASRC